MKIRYIVLMLVLTSFLCGNPLDIFEPYMGVIWEGHYQESEDSSLTHFIYWEYSLDSSRVFQIKTVPELDFKMVTTYYMDERWKELASLTLLDQNTYAVGYAHKETNYIEIYSKNYHSKGFHETISQFELWEGNFIDRFYRKTEENWYLGHTIFYKALLISEAFERMKSFEIKSEIN
ncbi:MAG: hypothetical protein KAH15_06090 [Candidatus Marinimicrobia bacterium]|nr:hypothetical protein [Candidatus Neomarinimicrobiota bacterium]